MINPLSSVLRSIDIKGKMSQFAYLRDETLAYESLSQNQSADIQTPDKDETIHLMIMFAFDN